MIIVGIGANLAHPEYGLPRRTCGAALAMIDDMGIPVIRRSRWYESAPVVRDGGAGPADQPWYVNGAIETRGSRGAEELLAVLLRVEDAFGRQRSVPDAPRTLDLDILVFDQEIIRSAALTVPHPRLHQRAFALLPIADLAPQWRHPETGETVAELIEVLGNDQGIQVQADAAGYMGTEWMLPSASE
ncbi:MAG: 2-amino-4-hydroxy-6-hydroxymethyldihydropteridine diphosphokinase [Rhodospirillales bacterium]